MTRIHLVQGDTRPPIYVHLSTAAGPINVSSATVRLKFRARGDDNILFAVDGVKLTGTLQEDGITVDDSQYPVAGSGGRVRFDFPVGSLDVDPGHYEGEIEVDYGATNVFTPYTRLKFLVREDF